MNDSERDHLTRELLTGDEVSKFRQQSLQKALMALRQRRRRGQALRVGAVIGLVSLLGWTLLRDWRAARDEVKDSPRATKNPAIAASAAEQRVGVTFISDEELFALFSDRPMALIGTPGHQQVVFFGRPAYPGDSRLVSQLE